MPPKTISVIMSVFNCEILVSEAVESVINQSFKDYDLIIVDDGSYDHTLDVIKKYATKDRRIKILRKENTGLTDSLNVAMSHATGEWIARLDADDIAMPDRFLNQIDYIKKNPNVALLGGGCLEIDETGRPIKQHIYSETHEELLSKMETGKIFSFFPHSSVLFNRALVNELGGYNKRYLRSQDSDLWLRISEAARIASLQKPLVKLRRHSGMLSNPNKNRLQAVMGMTSIACHFRRKWNCLDPSQVGSYEQWKHFLFWVEDSLEKYDLFRRMQEEWNFKEKWFARENKSRARKISLAVNAFIRNKTLRKSLWKRLNGENIPYYLAKNSLKLSFKKYKA